MTVRFRYFYKPPRCGSEFRGLNKNSNEEWIVFVSSTIRYTFLHDKTPLECDVTFCCFCLKNAKNERKNKLTSCVVQEVHVLFSLYFFEFFSEVALVKDNHEMKIVSVRKWQFTYFVSSKIFAAFQKKLFSANVLKIEKNKRTGVCGMSSDNGSS